MDKTLEALKNRQALMESSLRVSPTAYARETTPTAKDISTSTQLASVKKQIESLKSKQIRSKWYGADDPSAEIKEPDKGWFIGGLEHLQRPMSAVIGAGQYALGKGTESSLIANINRAMKKGLVAGDVLKQFGAPRGVQVPLGFALDVMFDPINWLTAGTAALIPRVGAGLVRGGLKGAGVKGALGAAKTGAVSGLERKAAITMGLVPFAKFAPKYKDLATRIGKKAVTEAEKYDVLMGKTVFDKLGRSPFGFKSGVIGETVETTLRKIPSVGFLPSGDKVADFFKYSTKYAADLADLQDRQINIAKGLGVKLVRSESGAHFKLIDDALSPGATINVKDKLGEIMEVGVREADGAIKSKFVDQITVHDSLENAKRLFAIAEEDYNLKNLTRLYRETPLGKTGVRGYDDAIDRLKNTTFRDLKDKSFGPKVLKEIDNDAGTLVKTWDSYYDRTLDLKPFEKLLKGHEMFLSIFKPAKVVMNVSSHVVARLGNYFMGAMMGIPVWRPEYIQAVKNARKLVGGKMDPVGFKKMFFEDSDALIELAVNNPTRFQQFAGISAGEITQRLQQTRVAGKVLSDIDKMQEMKKILKEALEATDVAMKDVISIDTAERLARQGAKATEYMTPAESKLFTKQLGKFRTPLEKTEALMKEVPIRRGEEFGNWSASEITHNAHVDRVKNWIAKKAQQDPLKYGLADTVVNAMPRWYEHIDQSCKIGGFNFLTTFGLNEAELKTISRTISLSQSDVLEPVIRNGEKFFRLTPLKASEVVTEAFMNYAAMPDFVRVMRSLPVVGSPFISFSYAMAAKTGKTVMNNPAIFNKIGFAMDEMNVGRSPEEKIALEEKYNKYLNSPTVFKMFGMWNTDAKRIVPYYSMSMLSPSERTYDDSARGKILQMVDKVPMFQHPVGQTFLDYVMHPWILSGTGQTPQGLFGQPLYPSHDVTGKQIDVSGWTKAGYATRTLVESVVPGSLSYLGLSNIALGLSPETINYLPLYGARNLANATRGRSTIGAMTKENAMQKTLRSLLGRTGLPAYTLDTTKTLTR